MLKTAEHYELMESFEREHPGDVRREDKEMWRKGNIYCNGQVNELFLAYRRGYALGRAIGGGDE